MSKWEAEWQRLFVGNQTPTLETLYLAFKVQLVEELGLDQPATEDEKKAWKELMVAKK